MTGSGTRPWTWPHLVAVTLARSLLVGLLGLAAWGAVPAAIGWHPTTVSSGSMMPRLHVGDVAVSRPLGAHVPPLSSVLLFHDPDHPDRLRMHRFVRVDDDGLLVTRGDANADDDSSPVPLGAVVGIGTLRVPWIALPIVWLREGRWLPLGLVAGGLALALAVVASGRDRGHDEPLDDTPDDSTHGAGPDPSAPVPSGSVSAGTAATWPGVLRRAATLLGAGLLATSLATSAQAAFVATTTSSVSLALSGYPTCASAMTAFGPTLWYRLDETSSTATAATDSSGNARTGVYGAVGKTTTTGKACTQDTGRAMTFDGTTGYLSSPQLAGALPNTFSLTVWFRTTTKTGGKLIGFGNQQTGASGVYDRHLYLTNTGQLVFGVYPGAVKTLTSTTAYNDGAWHLGVATLSSAGMRLYVDGAQVAADTTVTTGEGVSNGYLRVAYDNLDNWTATPSSRFFAGTLDDAALFPTALTATQVTNLYKAGTA